MRALWHLLLCGLVALGAQVPLTVREPGLTVRVVAKPAVLRPGTPEALHWVLDPFPAPADVLVSNAQVSQRLRDALGTMAAERERCLNWSTEVNIPCSFSGELLKRLSDLKFVVIIPTVLREPPGAPGAVRSDQLNVRYIAPVEQTVQSLRVEVSTRHIGEGSPDAADFSPLTLSYGEAAVRLHLEEPVAALAAVPIIVRFAEADRKRPGAGLFSGERLQQELLRVAAAALETARNSGVMPGNPVPADSILTSVEDGIRPAYLLPRTAWPQPEVDLNRPAAGSNDFTLGVRNLQFVSLARPQVVRGPIGAAANEAGEKKLQRLLNEATEALEQRFAVQFASLSGAVPTAASVGDLVRRLREAPEITGPVTLNASGSELIFEGNRRWILGQLDARVSLQAAFDPQELLTGQAEMSAGNILFNILKREIRETWALTFRGGPEVQKANLNFNITRRSGDQPAWTYGFDFNALYSRDRNQRLGNLPGPAAEDLKLSDREKGLLPKLFLELGRQGAWKNLSRVEAYLDWRNVRVQPRAGLVPALIDGQLSAFNLAFRQVAGHDFARSRADRRTRGGVGETTITLTGLARHAFRALAGDFPFHQYALSLGGEMFFGFRSADALFLRYTRGLGTSTAGTPVFQLQRLGGFSNLRGMEEGEFIGRQLAYEQSELGINTRPLWRAIFREQGGPAALPFASAFVTFFFDRGRVADRASVGDLLSLKHSAHGYGIALQLRGLNAGGKRANLSVGYARSPQSVLHKSGLMMTGITFDL